jgi:hypothetical protein
VQDVVLVEQLRGAHALTKHEAGPEQQVAPRVSGRGVQVDSQNEITKTTV